MLARARHTWALEAPKRSRIRLARGPAQPVGERFVTSDQAGVTDRQDAQVDGSTRAHGQSTPQAMNSQHHRRFGTPDDRCSALANRARLALRAALLACSLTWSLCAAQTPGPAIEHLRIVGGLGALNQYRRHEEPFWTQQLKTLSGGRATAEIVPFDSAGIRGQEMLRLVQLGAVPFGTSLLNLSAVLDAEIGAPDLAGLNPDIATLRRSIAAFRPHLEKVLRERYGSELLAVYAYPAQVTFCAKPMAGLADLKGRRVRFSSATQADWVTSLGGIPVQTEFTKIVASLRNGNIDCAITGTMSGNTIGLHEVTTHLYTMPVNWGVAAFLANGAAWSALSKDLQDLLRRELPKLEQAIWDEAENETSNGIACNIGAATCVGGRLGHMTLVPPSAADAAKQREIFAGSILPAYLKRCGPQCVGVWKQTIGPSVGIALP
jgi:TRAP-type C4-dicarboxylate transport system substrate-binding protein